ncbi:GNAT family N-acetyltransferase [Alicyclobacillus dauci]|uniref:GNAT family N-acetyltransferase n=1 Tax=Alicyclobacillus dauci TaxID=1475485 RepID=A0ABY6Z6R0_9BACL|nr:GNAT family N-acetyltransferase [Alicyclobacillus dauci]WAH38566.1 GNAT family N-acetyltransferase [Alicyclobacillus dauci]
MAQLTTKRLRMESWTIELADAAMNDQSKLSRSLGVTVPDDFPNKPVRHVVLPSKLMELREDPSRGVWSGIIIHVGDNIIIGSMGFKAPPDREGIVEIGYDIIPAYQSQGYATEMAKALIAWAFEQPSVRVITAECLPDNWASARVLQKVGMRQVNSSADMVRWELPRIIGQL